MKWVKALIKILGPSKKKSQKSQGTETKLDQHRLTDSRWIRHLYVQFATPKKCAFKWLNEGSEMQIN